MGLRWSSFLHCTDEISRRVRRCDARTSRRVRRAHGTGHADRGSSQFRHSPPLAPASSISTASMPDCTPPVPITGTFGSARVTSCTARQRDRFDRGSGQAAASPTEDRPASLRVDQQAHHGVHEGEPGCAGIDRSACAISVRSVTFGDNFANTGNPSPTWTTARTALAVASGSCENISERCCRFGQLTFTSIATRSSSAGRSSSAAPANSSTVCPQIDAMTRAPTARSPGRSCSIHAATPGTLQADRVEHPRRGHVQPWRGLPLPLGDRHRLGGDRAEQPRVAQSRDLGAVPVRARRGDDRVRQLQ